MAAVGKTRKSDRGSNIDKMKGIKVTDLLVPGLFILVFGLLTFFVYIPSLQESNDMRLELSDVRDKQRILEQNLAAIQPLINDKAQLNRDLVTTESIIPKNLKVADFSYYVDKIARDAGLEFKEIKQQNNLNTTLNSTQVRSKLELDATVSSVQGPITYQGTYDQIVDFLDRLQKDSPYIVEVVQLELAKDSSIREDDEEEGDESDDAESNAGTNSELYTFNKDDKWLVQLSISGYFISEDSEVTSSTIYQKMVPYTDYKDVLNVFNYKATILEEAGDLSTPDDRDNKPVEDEEAEEER